MAIFNFFKKGKPKPEPEPVKKAPPKRKEGGAYKLLKQPHISEKATVLSERGKYIFKVYPDTNKTEIKKAIADLYGVAVKKINIINIKTKKRRLRGKEGRKPGYKKAIVTLERGHKIEILPH